MSVDSLRGKREGDTAVLVGLIVMAGVALVLSIAAPLIAPVVAAVGGVGSFWQARRVSRRFWLPFTLCLTALIVSIMIDLTLLATTGTLHTTPAIPVG